MSIMKTFPLWVFSNYRSKEYLHGFLESVFQASCHTKSMFLLILANLLGACSELQMPVRDQPYGTEAMGIMRIEKGHVAGPELDGRMTASDLGLQKLVSTKKDFIGSVMMQREGLQDKKRPKLVGLVL